MHAEDLGRLRKEKRPFTGEMKGLAIPLKSADFPKWCPRQKPHYRAIRLIPFKVAPKVAPACLAGNRNRPCPRRGAAVAGSPLRAVVGHCANGFAYQFPNLRFLAGDGGDCGDDKRKPLFYMVFSYLSRLEQSWTDRGQGGDGGDD